MLVIGNGESRKDIDINAIPGIKVGCNAIFRDYTNIDHIICVDKRMVSEAIKAGANVRSNIYTREDWLHRFPKNQKIRQVPKLWYEGTKRADEPFQWGSGPYAVLLAAKHDKVVNMLGFDLYGSAGKTNNIYKNTANYNTADKRAVDQRYWIHQIAKIFEHYKKTEFNFYNDNFEMPEQWKCYVNLNLYKINKITTE
jgi:hypothetical protein